MQTQNITNKSMSHGAIETSCGDKVEIMMCKMEHHRWMCKWAWQFHY